MDYQVSKEIAEKFEKLLAMDSVQAGLKAIEEDQDKAIAQQIELVKVEAPTFHEENKAALFKSMLEAEGLEDIHIDRGGSVVGLRKGTGEGPTILVEGHLDTVFPFGSLKEVTITDDGFIHAPGIGDDTRALAMILSCVRGLNRAGIRTKGDIYFVGTTREEGMGSLGGMKDFLDDHEGQIDATISIDGGDMASVTFEATGFRTYEVNFYGIGGHAYGAFGLMANPLHAAARAVAKIADFKVPEDPKTTFCVSNFHAGNDAGVHAIVPQAQIKFNIRSNDQAILDELRDRCFAAVQEACDEETARWGKDTITWDSKQYCEVPAGVQDSHIPMVEACYSAIKYLGVEPVFAHGGSTNANIAIGKGLPAICIGRGWYPEGTDKNTRNHTLLEQYPIPGAYKPVQETFLMALLCAGVEGLEPIVK